MIVLFTDFGSNGPYVGQMKAVIYQINPAAIIVDLFADAPGFNPRSCGYLLSAYSQYFPEDTIFLCVVDPSVGTDQRKPVVAKIDGQLFVGPNNGLFDVVAKRSKSALVSEVLWRPDSLSATFHGRDLFAPIAGHLSLGGCPEGYLVETGGFCVDEVLLDLFEIVYIDDYGNAMTGIRACSVTCSVQLKVNDQQLRYAKTFAAVSEGEMFWYENSVGLIELSENCGNAAATLGLNIGDMVEFVA